MHSWWLLDSFSADMFQFWTSSHWLIIYRTTHSTCTVYCVEHHTPIWIMSLTLWKKILKPLYSPFSRHLYTFSKAIRSLINSTNLQNVAEHLIFLEVNTNRITPVLRMTFARLPAFQKCGFRSNRDVCRNITSCPDVGIYTTTMVTVWEPSNAGDWPRVDGVTVSANLPDAS